MGIRESRVIVGRYVLTAEDIIACRRFGDAIAVAGYPVDIHHAKGGDCTMHFCDDSYDIPYRSPAARTRWRGPAGGGPLLVDEPRGDGFDARHVDLHGVGRSGRTRRTAWRSKAGVQPARRSTWRRCAPNCARPVHTFVDTVWLDNV